MPVSTLGFVCAYIDLIIDLSSVEELCSLDFYHSGTLSCHDQMEMVLSACKQIHKAGFLSSILDSQVFGMGSVHINVLTIHLLSQMYTARQLVMNRKYRQT